LHTFILLVDGQLPEEYVNRRRLQGASDSPVVIDSPQTSQGSTMTVSIANLTQAIEFGYISNATYFQSDLQGSVKDLTVQFNSGDELDEVPSESEATFTNLFVKTTTDLIQWPTPTDSIPIAEFNNVAILQRSELKSYKESYITTSDVMANGTDRRSLDSNEMKFKAHMEDFRMAVEEFLNHRETMLASRGIITGMEEDNNMSPQDISRRLASLTESKSWATKMKGYSLELVHREIEWFKNYRIPSNIGYLVIPSNTAKVVILGEEFLSYFEIRDQISSQCFNFRQEILEFYDNIDFFVMTNLQNLNNLGVKILILLNTMKDLETDLKNTKKVETFLSKLIPFLEKIPYAGPIAKVFYTAFHITMTQTNPVTVGLTNINKKIDDLKIKKRLETILNVTIALGSKINNARDRLAISGHALIIADAYCSSNTTQNLCQEVGGFISPVNDELNKLRQEVITFISDLKGGLHDIADTAESAISSKIYQGSMSVMSKAAEMFDILDHALDKEISGCVTNPVCGFKSQDKCASVTVTYYVAVYCTKWGVPYPCGSQKKTATTRKCVKISVPYSCPLCVKFTVNQIVNGVVSISSLITGVIEKALKSFIESLGIKFDVFKLPGMPGADDLQAVTASLAGTFNALNFDPSMPALIDLTALIQTLHDKLDINKATFPKCKEA
jgi:hypothetical protein